MIDQYKEQYKKETEQIHAPIDLIVRTKEAVRKEEARIQAERGVQAAESGIQKAPAARKKRSRGAASRSWAYALTAAAAILVLASVSMMMRGLRKSGADTAVYESAAETEELAVEEESGAAFDETSMAADAASDEGAVTEAAAGAAFDEEAQTESVTAAAPEEEAEAFREDIMEEPESEASDSGAATGGMRSAADELSLELKETENSMSQKQEAEREIKDAAAALEGVTIEKVGEKPDFANRADAESRTYEGLVFQVVKEKGGWAAYVEKENGDGYVIRGEAETMEAFLEAGYRKLKEDFL